MSLDAQEQMDLIPTLLNMLLLSYDDALVLYGKIMGSQDMAFGVSGQDTCSAMLYSSVVAAAGRLRSGE